MQIELTELESGWVPVIEAAKILNLKKQHMFKILKRFGIKVDLKKSESIGSGQRIAFISNADFKTLSGQFFIKKPTYQDSCGIVFYLIQLEPEHDPGRFKLGITSNLQERLSSHRTSAPFARVVKTWPCNPLWEKTAIDCASRGCTKIHTEVFKCNCITAVANKCDLFFNLMNGSGGGSL